MSTLLDDFLPAGYHQVMWSGSNHAGSQTGIRHLHLLNGYRRKAICKENAAGVLDCNFAIRRDEITSPVSVKRFSGPTSKKARLLTGL
ncbi:MAG: hypothetical protein WAN36_01800 [Calditrichia bacterium]